MKKIFVKPYNLLFLASAVIFLQFFTALIYYYVQVLIERRVNDFSYYIYLPYCIIICVISAMFILKKHRSKTELNAVKMWFAGFFIYALFEIVFFIIMLLSHDIIFDERVPGELTVFLYNSQPLYRLYLCGGAVLLIYLTMFFRKNKDKENDNGKKKIFAVSAGANLLIIILLSLLTFVLGTEYFLFYGDENIFEALMVMGVREAGILIYMLNMFAAGLYKLYEEK